MSQLSPARRWLLTAITASSLVLTAACGIGAQDEGADSGSDAGGSSQSDGGASDDAGSSDDAGAADPASFDAGDYEAEGSYETPGGTQSVVVDATIEDDGTITALEVEPQATSGNSVQYQEQFAGGIADEVVGQRITDLSVDKVAGSSLTSGGFNAAIDDIVAQAGA